MGGFFRIACCVLRIREGGWSLTVVLNAGGGSWRRSRRTGRWHIGQRVAVAACQQSAQFPVDRGIGLDWLPGGQPLRHFLVGPLDQRLAAGLAPGVPAFAVVDRTRQVQRVTPMGTGVRGGQQVTLRQQLLHQIVDGQVVHRSGVAHELQRLPAQLVVQHQLGQAEGRGVVQHSRRPTPS